MLQQRPAVIPATPNTNTAAAAAASASGQTAPAPSSAASPAQNSAIQQLRTITLFMDEALPIPGTGITVGLDALMGLIPGIGDFAGTAISGYALLLGARLGAPTPVLARMLMNIGVDSVVGAVPVLGDLFDLTWKANRRNLDLLERFVKNPAPVKRASLGITIGVVAAFLLLLVGMGAAIYGITAGIAALFRG